MKREIKFKAKICVSSEASHKDTWIYGQLTIVDSFPAPQKLYYINTSFGSPYQYQVYPETICEFVGYFGINKDVEVYEGDIVSKEGAYIAYDNELKCWGFTFKDDPEVITPLFHRKEDWKKMQIYGNIHDKN